MKFSIVAVLPALLIGASAGVIDNEKRTTCHLNWNGVNSEGGGGPGQVPINNNNFGLTVTGHKKYHESKKPTGANGVFDITVPKGKWGGDHDLHTHAQWNYGGNKWYRCSASKNGHTYKGKVLKQHITTGTVSTTEDHCVIDFPCK